MTKSASHSHPQLRAGGCAAWAWHCGHSPSSISRPWRRAAGAGLCLCSRARPRTGLPGDPADSRQGWSSPRSRASGQLGTPGLALPNAWWRSTPCFLCPFQGLKPVLFTSVPFRQTAANQRPRFWVPRWVSLSSYGVGTRGKPEFHCNIFLVVLHICLLKATR